MSKIILFFIFNVFMFSYEIMEANIKNIKNLEKQKIMIMDVRTPLEWSMTGTIPKSKKIMFFYPDGTINPDFFKNISKKEKFAIICRTGHRTKIIARILDKKGYKVIDLKGGMFALFKDLLKSLN